MRAIIATCLFAMAGCGPDAGRGTKIDGGVAGIPGLQSIDVAPASASYTIVNNVAATGDFKATGHFAGGKTEDITTRVAWSLADPGLGSGDGGHFVSVVSRGGQSQLQATDGVKTGAAQIIVKLVETRVSTDDGATTPADAATRFGAATTNDPTLAPPVVYPLDGVYVPINLGELEVQWTKPAATADLFEVSFEAPTFDLKIYTNKLTGAGGRASLLAAEWSSLADSVQGQTVAVAVRAMNTADPTKAGGAQPVSMTVGPDEVKGGIYYWASSGLTGAIEGIKRHEFGDVMGLAQDFYTQTDAGDCVACHVVSRDGTKIAITYTGGDGVAGLLDVATKNPLIPKSNGLHWNFASMSPDGLRMVASSHGVFTIYDTSGGAATGMALGTVDTGGYGTHPDWAPNGTQLVFVRAGMPTTNDWVFTKGLIVTLTDSGAGFVNPKVLVQSAGENNYYPSFSPDGKWILFNRSTGDSYDDPDAELWVVSADGAVPAQILAKANAVGNITNSWPRWSPFVQKDAAGGDLLYFTFSSKRDYGIEVGSLNPANPNRPQVWMSAFDPQHAATQTDPSSAPFWLPFQDVNTNNHIAQWTTAIVGIN